ncbi:hypothetical protein CG017_00171 [Burkholderia glumae]|nr:hypothetical protein CG017_00171 [Burkholderia glumae]
MSHAAKLADDATYEGIAQCSTSCSSTKRSSTSTRTSGSTSSSDLISKAARLRDLGNPEKEMGSALYHDARRGSFYRLQFVSTAWT